MGVKNAVVNPTRITVTYLLLFLLSVTAYAEIDTTFYQLNGNSVAGNFNITEADSDEQSVFFIAQEAEHAAYHRVSENNGLWHLDKQTSRYQKLTFSTTGEAAIVPAAGFSELQIIAGSAYFLALGSDGKENLWKYDPNCDCVSGLDSQLDSFYRLASYNNQWFLIAGATQSGGNLWKLDVNEFSVALAGGEEHQLASLYEYDEIFATEEALYFLGRDSSGVPELWQYRQDQLIQLEAFHQLYTVNGGLVFPRIVSVDANRIFMDFVNDIPDNLFEGQLWSLDLMTGETTKIADMYHAWECDNEDSPSHRRETLLTTAGDFVYYVNIDDAAGIDYSSGVIPGYHLWRYDLNTGDKTQISGEQFERQTVSWCPENPLSNFHSTQEQLYFSFGYANNFQVDLYSYDLQEIQSQSPQDINDALISLGEVHNFDGITATADLLFFNPTRNTAGNSPTCNQAVDLASDELRNISYGNEVLICRGVFVQDSEILVIAGQQVNREQIWRLDTDLQTEQLTDIQVASYDAANTNEGIVVNDKFYFVADSGIEGRAIWRLSATGEPVLLPFTSQAAVSAFDKEILLEKAVNHYLYFSAPVDGTKHYFELDSRDDSVTPLTSLNQRATDRNLTLSLFQQAGDVIFFRHRTRSNISVVFSYNTTTKETHSVFSGDGQVAWVDEDNVYVFREVDFYYGLWRYDLVAKEYVQIETSPIEGCQITRLIEGTQFGDNIYFSRRGDVMRYNPTTEEFAQLGCGNQLFPADNQLLVLLQSEGSIDGTRHSSLWQVNDELSELQQVSPKAFPIDGKFSKGKFYYIGENEQGTYGFWRYDPETEELTLQNEFTALINTSNSDYEPRLLKLAELNGEIYFLTYSGMTAAGRIDDLQLWQSGVQEPVINFSHNAISPTTATYMLFLEAFAGDLFLPGTVLQQGSEFDSVLIRVETNVPDPSAGTALDFDGDGKADIALRDAPQLSWSIYQSSDEDIVDTLFGRRETDIPVPADFDGDGITDIAFRRPATRMWYTKNSSGNNYNSDRQDGIQRVRFAFNRDDIPVPADYDGDGIADMAVRRPSFKGWIIRQSSNDEIVEVKFGLRSSDIPVVGDFDGDGKADVAFRRRQNKTWYVQNSSGSNYASGRADGIQRIVLGRSNEDIPVPADYDGDGITDMAVWRPSFSGFIIRQSSTGNVIERRFSGMEQGLPVSADYDGDGIADTAVYLQGEGLFSVRHERLDEAESEAVQAVAPGLLPTALPVPELMNLINSDCGC